IARANLNGTSIETLYNYRADTTYDRFTLVAVDPDRGKLYWGYRRRVNQVGCDLVQRANFDGSGAADIHDLRSGCLGGLPGDRRDGLLYWLEGLATRPPPLPFGRRPRL